MMVFILHTLFKWMYILHLVSLLTTATINSWQHRLTLGWHLLWVLLILLHWHWLWHHHWTHLSFLLHRCLPMWTVIIHFYFLSWSTLYSFLFWLFYLCF